MTREEVLIAVATHDEAATNALLRLWARQTADERAHGDTVERNGRGFTATDAAFLSSVAERAWARLGGRYARRGERVLSVRQLAAVRRALPKYVGQLVEVAGEIEWRRAERIRFPATLPPSTLPPDAGQGGPWINASSRKIAFGCLDTETGVGGSLLFTLRPEGALLSIETIRDQKQERVLCFVTHEQTLELGRRLVAHSEETSE